MAVFVEQTSAPIWKLYPDISELARLLDRQEVTIAQLKSGSQPLREGFMQDACEKLKRTRKELFGKIEAAA